MTHALNLAKFTAVASAIAFAFAFNLAAMYAQVVYVFLPGTRVHGGAPADWRWQDGHGFLFDLVSNRPLFLALLIVGIVVCAIVVRRSPK